MAKKKATRDDFFRRLGVVGTTRVEQLRGSPTHSPFFFVAKMAIDADGAPNAYAPLGLKGAQQPLDRLGNACSKPANPALGDCWGIYKNKDGTVPVQDHGHPFPGFFISTTSLADAGVPEEPADPGRYVDSTQIPYIVLPGPAKHPGPFGATGLRIGDLALVVNGANGKFSFAIYADWKSALGEGSIALAQALGINASAATGGAKRDILYIVFPGSGAGQGVIPTAATIDTDGTQALTEWDDLATREGEMGVADFLDEGFPQQWGKWSLSASLLGYLPTHYGATKEDLDF